jgi:hypothetical protein
VRKFSHIRSRSSLFVIEFQYVRCDTANDGEMSSSAWLARQLRHKSDEIHRLRQQIRVHQMNLHLPNQKDASLVEQLGQALPRASEIDPIPSPANQNFPDLLFDHARNSRMKQYSREKLSWAQQVYDISLAALNVLLGVLPVPSDALIRSRFHEVRSAVSGALLDVQQIGHLVNLWIRGSPDARDNKMVVLSIEAVPFQPTITVSEDAAVGTLNRVFKIDIDLFD